MPLRASFLLHAIAFAFAPLLSSANAATFPDAHEKPPAGWTGPVFKLSQDYPSVAPSPGPMPWKKIDFKAEPEAYLRAVLAYTLEGNLDVDWDVGKNAVRKWYHAPWMHAGGSGREFIHGLTRERSSRPKALASTQTTAFQNWAVGFYNAPGGHVIGKVWADANDPKAALSRYPDGTVTAKLLFSEATVAEVPYVKDSFEWVANIWTDRSDRAPNPARSPQPVRLLQLDLAVRDSRADSTTGWLFGTFVYEASAAGDTPWKRLVPVGLMWGNDPTIRPSDVTAGKKLVEGWVNPALLEDHDGWTIRPGGPGWAGRVNGPVDNPLSSCLSCHATAQVPGGQMAPPENATEDARLRWFRNIKAGAPFDSGADRVPADYSLQIVNGIRSFKATQEFLKQDFAKRAKAPGAAGRALETMSADAVATASSDALAAWLDQEVIVIDGKRYHRVTRD